MMTIALATYTNSFFNFYVNFLNGWSFRAKLKSTHNSNMHYQMTESDIPENYGDQKTLFSARYRLIESVMSRCNFHISVRKHDGYFDLLKYSQEKINVVACDYSQIKFLGRDAQEVRIEQLYNDKQLITKVVVWNELPELWIGGVAEGDSLENFAIAENLFSRIYRIKELN